MHGPNPDSLSLYFTREYLRAGVLVSLLSVWVLVGLFYYLNRYTKRRYFTIWTVAWLFYALWITLTFGTRKEDSTPAMLMAQQWCVGVAAVFLLWGSLNFLGQNVRQRLLAVFLVFLLVWSYVGATYMAKPEMEIPAFSLIALASLVTSWSFLKYRRKQPYIGATLLSVGFLLWGVYMGGFPFMERSPDLTSLALFISATLQLLLAVSMIILVLEETRHTQQLILDEAQLREAERDALKTRITSTEERYRNLFDQAGEAIVITNTEDFRILELNRAAETLLGMPRADAVRHSLTAFCHVKSPGGALPKTSSEWFQVLCHQHPLNLARKNGGVVSVTVNATLADFGGQPAYQFFLVELTERAQLEQQLRQAEKLSALGQMISGVAHELNNPLAVVKGYLELVLSHHELSAQTRADLEKAARESNRAAKLVMNFLSFAREQPAHREVVDLNELIRRLVELRKFDLLVAKTELVLELEPQLPPVSADPDQVQQVVVNLMNNALQAMVDLPSAGRLKIQTRRAGEMVRLSVEDNGPGVPPHLAARIFEPFFTTKEVGAGTGLGLSIAHSIMTEHKGRIFYETSALGGAGFVLEFPAAKPGAAAEVDGGTVIMTRKPSEDATPREGRILVLDDETSIAEMLGEMLGLLGYTPTLSHAPMQAIELMEEQEFDLIISDFRMPGLNGQQFYEMVARKKPEMARRIVFLTGDMVNEETQDFLKASGSPHLAKPFNLENVKRIVAEVLQANPPREPAVPPR